VAKLSLMIEGQEGLDWETWRHLCEISEELGFDSLWRSDHLISLMGDPERDCIECWTSLALAAVWTERITFGPNVSPMTFREPGVLAKQAAAVDILSGGRLMLGVGAGWNENEHTEFHVPFLTLKGRMDLMDRSIEVIEEVWAKSRPKPVRDGKVPFLIGGGGEKRTLRTAARHATLWSVGVMPPLEDYRHKTEVLAEHCRAIGRDPASIRRGIQSIFVIGRDEAEIRDRVQALKRRVPRLGELTDDEVLAILRERNFAGTPAEIAAKMRGYQELGVDLWMLQHFDWRDDASLRLLMSDLAPLIA
jgi:alkanesulfonate monooxygenase SsuD/methylene tetrahydromethanopterin reductase-like flavin-dependent oxidoreductase (luciferase family)